MIAQVDMEESTPGKQEHMRPAASEDSAGGYPGSGGRGGGGSGGGGGGGKGAAGSGGGGGGGAGSGAGSVGGWTDMFHGMTVEVCFVYIVCMCVFCLSSGGIGQKI